MMNYLGRFIPRDTVLICPQCLKPQAVLTVDIVDANQAFNWNCIKPINDDSIIGVSDCCLQRYVTFDGLFFTEDGPV